MKKILNPWVGRIAGYNCFGCDPNNPIGTHMNFYEEGDDIVSVWQPTNNHISWVNTLHGGVQAVLLDEICGWVIFQKLKTSGVTAKMETRYKKVVPTNQGALTLRAHIKSKRWYLVTVEGFIYAPDDTLCTQCECTYYTFPDDKAKEMGFLEPTLDSQEISIDQLKK